MSGHSKWATIKHQKGAADKKRGLLFSKISRAITLAVKEGGGPDPDANFKLRLLIDKAKIANMPKSKIQAAIDRATGKTGSQKHLEEVTYEGFGPDSVALLVNALTSNRNKTSATIKFIFDKHGGSLGNPGSCAYLFQTIGQITVDGSNDIDAQMLQLIDLGVDDVSQSDNHIIVYVQPEELESAKQSILSQGHKILLSQIVSQPKTKIKVSKPADIERLRKLISALEEHPDVRQVVTNWDSQA